MSFLRKGVNMDKQKFIQLGSKLGSKTAKLQKREPIIETKTVKKS
jgi:hypothetical protein